MYVFVYCAVFMSYSYFAAFFVCYAVATKAKRSEKKSSSSSSNSSKPKKHEIVEPVLGWSDRVYSIDDVRQVASWSWSWP